MASREIYVRRESSDAHRHAVLQTLPESCRELAASVKPRRLARMLQVLDQRMEGVAPVLEALRRRHNVSAIIRSADAMGLHRVHLVTGSFKPSPGPARGSERWMDLVRHADTSSCLRLLKGTGFRVFVADMTPDAMEPGQVPVDRPLAVLFGSELAGVSPQARAMADGAVALPMRGFVESLNVSVAAAIILQDLARRRRALTGPDLSPSTREAVLLDWLSRERRYRAAATRRTNSPGPQ